MINEQSILEDRKIEDVINELDAKLKKVEAESQSLKEEISLILSGIKSDLANIKLELSLYHDDGK